MIIKINDFSAINHEVRSKIVDEYFKQYESTDLTHNGWLNSLKYEYDIKTTGKYPIKISLGSYNYHVKCRKTKTTLVFDIWLAV
jgi:hypothetical protein